MNKGHQWCPTDIVNWDLFIQYTKKQAGRGMSGKTAILFDYTMSPKIAETMAKSK